MKTVNLTEQNSVANQYLKEMRCVEIQKDPLRFRQNIIRLGEILGYEISKTFDYSAETIQTPLAETKVDTIVDNVIIATILRAGLPYHQGFLNIFDRAENAFVSAYRKYISENDFDIHIEYIASPRIDGKTLIITDPMLATGGSMELAYKALLSKGKPKRVIFASIISTQEALDNLEKIFGDEVETWTIAIDPILNEHKYIVPGLGDAGDLAYGEKE